ncbi:nitric oxide synthase 2b, inducible [Denticeps clupeoides]|uniref:Nitric oxide synthase n=1 Tax=Denticeps clupeoides TaxID=299321 RepID=A0AAY4D4T1_9TELE|nr:nitric oxide synthase, inducible [Denticeps clupeoides]
MGMLQELKNLANAEATKGSSHDKIQTQPWQVKPTKCPFSMRLRNFKDGSSFQDTLHHHAAKNQACKSRVCEGSIMNPKTLIRSPLDAPISTGELMTQAIDFINQYYKSLRVLKTEEHLCRVKKVALEIDATGTYQLTPDELAFGAKQAWRNAPRCIGRIQWSNLQMFDARKCRTAREMFSFLCDHIKFATNGGNLRSAITIFPQRSDGKHDFRVWNSQLLKYAGYLMPDGSVQGDPSSVDFTEVCVRLGWKPKYGRFDVLPLVLQASGEDPEVFEIPPELVLEVPMEHPEYDWFRDLNLRWYAVPAVASMLMEVGGLEFPACPFNGWYMGTEIGVRDFCDSQRYNILEEVGRRMGLDTHKLSSLWKDQALVTINVAVIHSFQRQKVTITDHHSASESFLKHMETEVRLRGGCPADWVWLVPPMSGSLTGVFHQEMVNYILSPFYYYQPDAWLTHTWKDEKKSLKKRRIHFRALARAALFSVSLFQKAMAQRVDCTVLYATETGKSQTFARKLNSMLNCAFNSRVLCMEDYDFSDLEEETLLAVVTSTFGNGDSPGNGESFRKDLLNLQTLQNKFKYCVFGLGSRMYPQFCAFAHKIDARLADLGARRLMPTGEGDELNGQEEAFSAWAQAAFQEACKEFKIQGQITGLECFSDAWDPSKYRVQLESSSVDHIRALTEVHSKIVIPMRLKHRENLQSPESSHATILVELEKGGEAESLLFSPGDHVGVFPANPPEVVNGILKNLPNAPPHKQSLRLERLSATGADGSKCWQSDRRIPACPLSQALTYLLDITTPPSQGLLQKLSQMATKEGDRHRLLTMAKDIDEYMKWKDFYRPNLLEVLDQFPSVEVSAPFLLSQLPLLKPRLYSVSSSQNLYQDEVHLTVSVVSYRTQDGQGPVHRGVCSNWLNSIKQGDVVPCFVHSSNGFHLPTDPTSPTILVGAGSGIAPYRSFWQQQLHGLKENGLPGIPMTLVFGCRNPDTDFLYKEELMEMRHRGALKAIIPAYSRRPGQPKVYVQDVLRKKLAKQVFQVLHQDEGHLYVCGSMSMAREVELTVQEILVSSLGIGSSEAKEYVKRLKTEKRYCEDIFGDSYQK